MSTNISGLDSDWAAFLSPSQLKKGQRFTYNLW